MVICVCNNITSCDIAKLSKEEGIHKPKEVYNHLGIERDNVCSCCPKMIKQCLEEE